MSIITKFSISLKVISPPLNPNIAESPPPHSTPHSLPLAYLRDFLSGIRNHSKKLQPSLSNGRPILKEKTKTPYYNTNLIGDDGGGSEGIGGNPTDNYIECIKITKKSKTSDNIGEIMLMQVPGVSASIAHQLLEPFEGNIYKFLGKVAESEDYLGTMRMKTKTGGERKLGKNIANNIQELI